MICYYSLAFLTYDSIKYKKIRFYTISSVILILLASGTRGPLIASFVFLVILFPFLYKKSFLKYARYFIIPFVVIAVFFINNIIQRSEVHNSVVDESYNFSGRSVAWEYFINAAPDFNLFGAGLGAVTRVTTYVNEFNLNAFITPHNEYIRFWFDLGWVGSICLFFILAFIVLSIFSYVDKKYKIFCFLFLVSFLIYSFVDNTLSTYQSTVMLAVLFKVMYFDSNRFSKQEINFSTNIKNIEVI
jgi:teichuronic acid biosynthesis protein TuaE